MPQQHSAGIDVSKEEVRYLRRAFRRFALPYVIAFAVLAWAATVVSKSGQPASSPDASSLSDKVAALEQSVAGLQGRMDKVGTELERTGSRMGALETRKANRDSDATDSAELERALRDANRRIDELEQRTGSGATAAERIDALTARMQRIEAIARSAASFAPAVPAPAPAVPAAPAPAPGP